MQMERYLTPPGSPPIPIMQLSTPSPRRIQSPLRRKANDTLIDQWTSQAAKIDDPTSEQEVQDSLADQVITTLRADLLKEIDKTDWMYNDQSYT